MLHLNNEESLSRKIFIGFVFISGVLYLMQHAFSLLNSFYSATSIADSPQDRSEPTKFIVHSLRVRKDLVNFSHDADVILSGVVKSIDGPFQDNPRGMIYSNITVSVMEYFKNAQPLEEIKIKRLGGKFAGYEVITDNQPQFNLGEKVLLFLGLDNNGDFVVYAGDYGKFHLTKEEAIGSENEKIKTRDLVSQIKTHVK